MRRLKYLIVALALFAFPGAAHGQGVNLSVSLSASVDKVGNFIEAQATASAFSAWITMESNLQGGGFYDSSYTVSPSYAHSFLYAMAVPDEYYTFDVAACADWYDGWWDCDFKFEVYYSEPVAPILSSIDPSSGNRGECYTLQLYGENMENSYATSDSLYLSIGSSNAYYNQITASLCVSSEAPSGGHSIWVTASGTNKSSSPKLFTVNE